MRYAIVLMMLLGLSPAAGAQDTAAEAAAREAARAAEDAAEDAAAAEEQAAAQDPAATDAQPDAGEDGDSGKLPKPLSDEEVAQIVQDEIDAVVFHWQSLSKNASVNLQTGRVSRSMSFSAILSLPNDTRIAGIGSQMFFATAVNEDGTQVLPNRIDIAEAFGGGPDGGHMPQTSYYPPQRDSNQPGPYRSVSGSINSMDHDAKSFQELAGYVPVRIAAQTITVDVPYEQTTDFADLAGDLNVMVQNIRDSGSYHEAMVYFTRDGQDPNQGFNTSAEPAVTQIEILDGVGEPMPTYNTSFSTTSFTHKGQRQYVYYMQHRVRKTSGLTPTTLRIRVALRMAEAPVKFAFEDVPLP